MARYQVKEKILYYPGIGVRAAFGIEAYKNHSEDKEPICCVHDVFTERERAERFVMKCNELRLSVIHLYDVLEDAIV